MQKNAAQPKNEDIITFRRVRGRIVPIRTKKGAAAPKGKGAKTPTVKHSVTTEVKIKSAFGGVLGGFMGQLLSSDYVKNLNKSKPVIKARIIDLSNVKAGDARGLDLYQFGQQAKKVAQQNRKAMMLYNKRSMVLGAVVGAGAAWAASHQWSKQK